VRAEVGGTVIEVQLEEGQRVQQGSLLGRIESQALEDAETSARSAVRSAEAALELARVEVRRNQELVAAGAIAQRDLDQARANLANAEAQLANARSNLAVAEEQLSHTVLRAPISGVVSRREVDSGDVVSVGADLFTIIDPGSMRLEASAPSEAAAEIRIGNRVRFTIGGFGSDIEGRIERITPEVDPVTRQIHIYVVIANDVRNLIAGLFAEGRVITNSAVGPIVPMNTINLEGKPAWVLRVREGTAERVSVTIALRDELTERVVVSSGINAGDILLRGTDQAIAPGAAVDIGP
jgi:RND family efflux transporter MFP subunit